MMHKVRILDRDEAGLVMLTEDDGSGSWDSGYWKPDGICCVEVELDDEGYNVMKALRDSHRVYLSRLSDLFMEK